MDGLDESIRQRLPLAEATLRLIHHALDQETLDTLYEENRGLCYQKQLSFPTLANLLLDALTLHRGSGHAAFEQAKRQGRLPVVQTNVYGKLGRTPLAVSKALLRQGSQRLAAILPIGLSAGTSWPKSLDALSPVAVDGKKIKNAAKRLAGLRRLPGKMLAAKLLAGVSLKTGLVVAFEADPDGERNDVPLVEGLLPQVRAAVAGSILWIADRQFADLNVPTQFVGQNDHYLIRMTKKMSFAADPERPQREGVDEEGRAYRQQWGWIGQTSQQRRRYVRWIELSQTIDGGDRLVVITDLLDADLYPAADLLEAYRQRWGIERVFQQVTEVFGLQTLIGSRPEGAVLQASLCFLLYNTIQVLRTHVSAVSDVAVSEVSGELLFRDIVKELTCWDRMLDRVAAMSGLEQSGTAESLREWLRMRLTGCWHEGWRKAKTKNKPPGGWKPPKRPPGHGGHTSVFRAMNATRRS
jgi:hypothetical protein